MSPHPLKKSNYLNIDTKSYEQHRLAVLEHFLDRIKDQIILVTEEGQLMYINQVACRVLGYSRDELLSMSISDIDAHYQLEHWREHWEFLKLNHAQTFETAHISKEGKQIPVEVHASYFLYEGSAYNLSIVQDITERKRTEKLLRKKIKNWTKTT
ncbi:PAS domain S-box protein [Sulfuricurvum sp.]|uniref:PAS domain S-box protein n=1 Tax=Sulfuricurvum sp. TaxID=2025608 RepID=UPI002E3173A4|nr:PAS domain S-box protein [Sulfuricurvum sp.]HEX5329121.1 PAS domain S-box protein [Sulfuricurvum sp.]